MWIYSSFDYVFLFIIECHLDVWVVSGVTYSRLQNYPKEKTHHMLKVNNLMCTNIGTVMYNMRASKMKKKKANEMNGTRS